MISFSAFGIILAIIGSSAPVGIGRAICFAGAGACAYLAIKWERDKENQ